MRFSDFAIGLEFWCGAHRWRCTDIGSRVVVAIRIDVADIVEKRRDEIVHRRLTGQEAEAEGWFSGPPYPVAEVVLDEDDIEGCSLERNPDA
ncbi:MAG TPA: hypothetical protein VGH40_17855 [Roseiarcus sp.]|jgi:hypothetical protein